MQDIVYIVRPGENNEELRYSLRSLEKNFPNHGTVWIIGYKPSWVQHVRTIYKVQKGTKYKNGYNNLLAAANHPEISGDFILMNDDFFVTKEITEIPRYNRGLLDDVIETFEQYGAHKYYWTMRHTAEYFRRLKIQNPLSYELHVPMIINKQKYIESMAQWMAVDPTAKLNKRTVYGNYVDYGGETIEDVKVNHLNGRSLENPTAFLSSDDKSFKLGNVGPYIKEEFKFPCRYEAIS